MDASVLVVSFLPLTTHPLPPRRKNVPELRDGVDAKEDEEEALQAGEGPQQGQGRRDEQARRTGEEDTHLCR